MAMVRAAELRSLEALRQQEIDLIRAAALESTWVMATMVLWPDVAGKHYNEKQHKPIWDWMDSCPQGGKRALICTREFRKSMYFVARDVRLICKYPNIRIGRITSYQKTAFDNCKLVKLQFQNNDHFRKVFPDKCVNESVWGKVDEFTHPSRNATGLLTPTYHSTYLGAPLISQRYDVMEFDDPVDEDKVLNPDVAQKTMDKFIETIPLLDTTSDLKQLLFAGTIKSYNDPASAILGNGALSDVEASGPTTTGWEIVVRPISYVPSGDFFKGGDFAFPDENSEAVPALPNVHTPAIIRDIYKKCMLDPAKGESYFYREYACLAQAPTDQKFLAEWFDTWIEPAHMPHNTTFSAIAIDSALKDEQIMFRGDTTVVLIGHRDMNGNLYLTDGARSKGWKAEDFRKVLLALCQNPKNRGAQNLLREKVGEGTFFPLVQGWFNEARMPVVLHPLKRVGMGKKYLMITEALQAPAMGRKIFFVKGMFPEEMHRVLVDELTHLGQWGHDDVADALSLFFHPEVNIVPGRAKSVQWTAPMSRQVQVSTAKTNVAAVQAAQNWQMRRFAPMSTPILKTTADVLKHEAGKRATFALDSPRPAGRPFSTATPWWEEP